MKIIHLTILMLLSSITLNAQEMNGKTPLSYVVQGEEVDEVWDIWLEENRSQDEIRVWSILVVGVESRREINSEINRFERIFPEMSFSWEYDPPFYKLKTGAFMQRLHAKPLLYKIKEEFPGALEIRDEIGFDEYFEEKQ